MVITRRAALAAFVSALAIALPTAAVAKGRRGGSHPSGGGKRGGGKGGGNSGGCGSRGGAGFRKSNGKCADKNGK